MSDYFPVHQRATALAIYSMGIYIGILAGYSIGGWIDATYGWRMAFFALGIPGIVYALVLFFTVKEPPKGHSDNAHQSTEKGEIESSFWEVVQLLLSKKTFVFVALACGFHTFGNYGVGNFYAPFLARVHGMPIEEIGIWLGVTTGFGGITGTFLGGYLVDKFGKKDLRWYLWIPVIAGLLNYLVSYYTFFGENLSSVLFCYAIVSLLTAMYLAPAIAITHNLVDAKKRALASAILFLVLNFIGLGLGPLGIGLMSDYLTPEFGAESLRYAFTMTWGTGFLAILCFYFAGKTYRQEAITKVTVTEVKTEISDMQPILQIVGGAFLLFVVGLFFLQIGLAGVGVTTLASWIFVVIGLLFFSGVYLLFKGIVNGK
ncbi:MAG: putative MFS family arabinose efflux permease [Paraglaciecola sp.]